MTLEEAVWIFVLGIACGMLAYAISTASFYDRGASSFIN